MKTSLMDFFETIFNLCVVFFLLAGALILSPVFWLAVIAGILLYNL
jgi:hypothetical protein